MTARHGDLQLRDCIRVVFGKDISVIGHHWGSLGDVVYLGRWARFGEGAPAEGDARGVRWRRAVRQVNRLRLAYPL